ncbi:MAG: GDCCVxC domain-containing (seleno)protein [Xanthobacteraceae bacterium]
MVITVSAITCPKCGHRATEKMPTDACQFFYDCKGCGERLKPKPGDCCVFCSYGSAQCPPMQVGDCCASPQSDYRQAARVAAAKSTGNASE